MAGPPILPNLRGGMDNTLGIVIPTLAEESRFSLLAESYSAAQLTSKAIVIVAPAEREARLRQILGGDFTFCQDPARGLSAAINAGAEALPVSAEFFTWIGDDDIILPTEYREMMSSVPLDSPYAVGYCHYISAKGEHLFTQKLGTQFPFLSQLIKFLPDLIPQPATLIRIDSFWKVGGLSESFSYAFDFDLWIKLSELGRPLRHRGAVANYRWHKDALSVKSRTLATREASKVRTSHRPGWLNLLLYPWEILLVISTQLAGSLLSRLGDSRRSV